MSKGLLCSAKSAERVFKGISHSGGIGCAIGRVEIYGRGEVEGAVLCIADASADRAMLELLSVLMPAGVILSPSSVSSALIELLVCKRIPYVILKESLPREAVGRVALLDSRRDEVRIDPDIDTLGDYFGKGSRAKEGSELPLLYGDRGGLMLLGDGLGQELSTVLESIIEEDCTREVTVLLSVPDDKGDRELFDRSIEAVFLSAVYGNIALVLESYGSDEDIIAVKEDIERICQELEAEGRELNRYISQGLLIDAPVWLLGDHTTRDFELLIFDVDKISAALLGCDGIELAEKEGLLKSTLSLWSSSFSQGYGNARIKARSSMPMPSEFLEIWRKISGAVETYSETERS